MSVSSEVQRTLVKSPPELWAELSDPAALARHLGELGEIRIVRTEPDRAVDWEAAATDGAQANGRVEIEPSGWGTKVTLSASRTIVEPAPEGEAGTEAAIGTDAETEVKTGAESEAEAETEGEAETGAVKVVVEPESQVIEPEIIEPEPRPGFFARFFRRRKRPAQEPALTAEPEPELAAEPEPDQTTEPELEPLAAAEIQEPMLEQALPEPEPVSTPDISAELAELEEQTTAMLTGVLDRLGAAHHRPFSRT